MIELASALEMTPAVRQGMLFEEIDPQRNITHELLVKLN